MLSAASVAILVTDYNVLSFSVTTFYTHGNYNFNDIIVNYIRHGCEVNIETINRLQTINEQRILHQ